MSQRRTLATTTSLDLGSWILGVESRTTADPSMHVCRQHQGAIKAGVRSITLTGPGEVAPRFTGYRWEPHYSAVQWVHSLPDLIQEIKWLNRPRLWDAKKQIFYRVIKPETVRKAAITFPKEDDSASPSSPTDTTDTTGSAKTTDPADTSPPSPTTPPFSPGASSSSSLQSAPVATPRDIPPPTRQNSLDKEKLRSSLDSFAMAESEAESVSENEADTVQANSFGGRVLSPACM